MSNPSNVEKEREKKLAEVGRGGEERAVERWASDAGLPYRRLVFGDVDRENLYIISRPDAERGRIIILNRDDKKLRVALVDPENLETKKILEQLKSQGFELSRVAVSTPSMTRVLGEYNKIPPPPKSTEAGMITLKKDPGIKTFTDLKEKLSSLPRAEASELLNLLLGAAIAFGASDIHIEPEGKQITIRLRLDGLLQNAGVISADAYKLLLSRIKLLSGIRINITDVPQNGRFSIKRSGHAETETRTSILPGAYGEFIVLRVLDPEAVRLEVKDLGLSKKLWEKIQPEIEKPNGIVLVTGPTGSGKTTTLYAFLKHLLKPEIKIITLEDPIEYHLEGVSQSQVDAAGGYTFAEGMKNALRQDPDIILIGEIRDIETAQTALSAALTGHFVFSTLHTNDAPGAVPRFLDLNAKPKILAPALNAVIAQRLVRTLCSECKEKIKVDDAMFKKIQKGLKYDPEALENLKKDSLAVYKAVGCPECSQVGYRGRTGIFEVIVIGEKLEELIGKSPSHQEVLELARDGGFVNMYHDGLLKVLEGITTLEEVEQVALALG